MRAIRYPFRVDSSGKVVTTNDFGKIYVDRVITLVSTIVGQRFMSLGYGIDLKKGLYENGNAYQIGMESAIREAMARWLPEVTINSYFSTPPNSEGVSEITLIVVTPNGETNSLAFKTVTINEDGNLSRS